MSGELTKLVVEESSAKSIKLMRPKKPKGDLWAHGFAVALAEIHRLGHDSSGVLEVVRNAGLTLKAIKDAGCDPYDWEELERAGVR